MAKVKVVVSRDAKKEGHACVKTQPPVAIRDLQECGFSRFCEATFGNWRCTARSGHI